MTDRDRDLVDATAAEKLTGLGRATLYRLGRERKIRTFRVLNRAVRFDRGDLERLVQEQPAHTNVSVA